MASCDEYSSSASSPFSEEDLCDRKRSSKKRNHRHNHRRDEEERDRKKSKKKKRHRRELEYDRDDSSAEDDSTSSEDSRRRNRHHRSRKERRKERKTKRRRQEKDAKSDEKDAAVNLEDRHWSLAEALHQLLEECPPLAADLPVMLIRMAGGTTFDLMQMTDLRASRGLERVFRSLSSVGVQRHAATGAWIWKAPEGTASVNRGPEAELVLVRVVRALLDQTGFTAQTVSQFETKQHKQQQREARKAQQAADAERKRAVAENTDANEKLSAKASVRDQTLGILGSFRVGSLGKELASICSMILEGESVSLDGLPDKQLRASLESLFQSCGLEKFEIEDDDDEEKADDQADAQEEKGCGEPTMGFGLPDGDDRTFAEVKTKLEHIQQVCEKQRRVLGPALPPAAMQEEDEEEEGPQLHAIAAPDSVASETLRLQVARRQRELRSVQAGLGPLTAADDDETGREEWMLVPGQHDFLDTIKSGQPIRGRKFLDAKKSSKDELAAAIDPEVKAEMDAIMEAHAQIRGPSLLDEHRAAQQSKKDQEADQKKNWKWSRDGDLDSGRRVDKDALKLVFGGAADGLKTKFQGGFHSSR